MMTAKTTITPTRIWMHRSAQALDWFYSARLRCSTPFSVRSNALSML